MLYKVNVFKAKKSAVSFKIINLSTNNIS